MQVNESANPLDHGAADQTRELTRGVGATYVLDCGVCRPRSGTHRRQRSRPPHAAVLRTSRAGTRSGLGFIACAPSLLKIPPAHREFHAYACWVPWAGRTLPTRMRLRDSADRRAEFVDLRRS